MEKKICKVCGIEFECSRMSPACKESVCHLCNTNLKTDMYILRGQIGQVTKENEKLKNMMLERVDIIEKKLTKDVPNTGVFKKEEFTDENIRNNADFYDDFDEIDEDFEDDFEDEDFEDDFDDTHDKEEIKEGKCALCGKVHKNPITQAEKEKVMKKIVDEMPDDLKKLIHKMKNDIERNVRIITIGGRDVPEEIKDKVDYIMKELFGEKK